MATPNQITQLRLMINEPINQAPWTDDTLTILIDANGGDLDAAAGSVWRSKAASVAHLVDISEGGSSRKMSDMYKNFIAIAEGYENPGGDDTGANRAPRTREITRS